MTDYARRLPDTIHVARGPNRPGDPTAGDPASTMEWVAWLAGEPWGDHDARVRADERRRVAERVPGWAHEQTITSDGASFWVDCDWCSQPVTPVDPGDSLETLLTAAGNHHRVCAIARQHTTEGSDHDDHQ